MSLLKRIYSNFVIGDLKNTEDVPDVDAWMEYLDSLPIATDAFSQSYNKYLCRTWYIPKPKLVLLNIVSLFGLLAALPRLLGSERAVHSVETDKLVVVESATVPYGDVIPHELVESHEDVVCRKPPAYKVGSLSRRAKDAFTTCAKAHPFSFYYMYYMLKELSQHTELVCAENPRAVAVYVNERNFAGPVLRMVYEDGGREFDSFMHGEYLLQLIHGYMSFTNFYVWDESYKDMFENILRCDFGACIPYKPKKLLKKWDLEDIEPDHFLTYYFSGESAASLERLAKALDQLELQGKKCLVRPHPRYSHTDLIEGYFSGRVEDPESVDLRQSLGSTRYACGINSTVLFEAQAEGRLVVLDDISNPAAFANLKARKFRLISEDCARLSDFLGEEPAR